MAKVTVYHVWGKTLAGRKIQLDTDKEPQLGKPIRIGGTLCEVTDFEVSTEWLKSVIEEPLSKFLETYTSDESKPIYDMADRKSVV